MFLTGSVGVVVGGPLAVLAVAWIYPEIVGVDGPAAGRKIIAAKPKVGDVVKCAQAVDVEHRAVEIGVRQINVV